MPSTALPSDSSLGRLAEGAGATRLDRRLDRRLVEAGVAAEHPLPALRTTARVCHVFGRRLYWVIGVEHIRTFYFR